MASKSAQHEPEKAEVIEALLDLLDTTLDRVKVLYEQYFLGMQKQPPTHLHSDIERKLRDLTQMSIRNTALRYRFATLQQKFGSYNSYWRRTVKQIENGTYHRNLSKISRQAATTGEDIPEEILAAMPKRMRDQVKRDRDAVLALRKRREGAAPDADFTDELGAATRPVRPADGAHKIAEEDDFDLDAYFASVSNDDAEPVKPAVAQAKPTPPAPALDPPTDREPFPPAAAAQAAPRAPATVPARPFAASQGARPIPVMPGASAGLSVPVESMAGPFAREPAAAAPTRPTQSPTSQQTQAIPRPVSVPGGVARGGTQQMPMPRPPAPPGETTRPVPSEAAVTTAIPRPPSVQPIPAMPRPVPSEAAVTTAIPRPPMPRPAPSAQPTQAMPRLAPSDAAATQAIPRMPSTQPPQRVAPSTSQPTQAIPRPAPVAPATPAERLGPPPGMTDADVTALYAKYVKAKEVVGEATGPGSFGKLLKTINAQAPKIMEQHKAKGVDFQVVIKDNQVVIRAKPKP